ncbi:MAG: N-formylglutamate deformylase [Woeseiaceae bacterium]
MTSCFDYHAGTGPLLISIPHDGRILPEPLAERLTEHARELPDTDWHVRRLYAFSKLLGASVIAANYSRYVIDLNRSQADETLYQGRFVTGLCPEQTFDGEDIYLPGMTVTAEEKNDRIARYWRPYHDKIALVLSEIKERFGYALLWDAHSIRSRVPLLFDGELPEFNFGTNDRQSCANDLIEAILANAASVDSVVVDARFKGGYVTRHYGEPASDIHAIQLELAQRSYMDEVPRHFDENRASHTEQVLTKVLRAFITSAASHYEGRQ